ncbi:hypothetical protein JAAARDRAFT_588724 [Jaapia argillacea MUCL 33604]|uniref:F-box domain-containing protein n=1 Tax=Jaapia argillacea MUCL 33604 TaxID=933084 RepID=A0A067PID7_9AGAM|nr:hypothetical protein JAAARDRAFT_588724 [Jaapia argillacea MUCL 33604]
MANSHTSQCLRREITRPEFRRLKEHARRVRQLIFHDKTIHPAILPYISHLASEEVLFSSLQILSLTIQYPDRFSGAIAFLSPSLREVTLRGAHGEGDRFWHDFYVGGFFDALQRIQAETKKLERLSLEVELSKPLLLLPRSDHLRTLSTGDMAFSGDSDLFHILPELSLLRDLTFGADSLHDGDAAPMGITMSTLATLIVTGSVKKVTRAMLLITAPILDQLILECTWGLLLDCETCITVAATQFASSLLNITVIQTVTCLPSGTTIGILSLTQPLISLPNLRGMNVHLNSATSDTGFSLSDGDCLKFAMACPSLESITLSCCPVKSPHPTFHALSAFASHCATLRSLKLPLNPSSLPPSTDIPALSHGLTVLEIDPLAKTQSIPNLAYLLHRTFPKLTSVDLEEDTSDELAQEWYMVNECLILFAQIKEDSLSSIVHHD